VSEWLHPGDPGYPYEEVMNETPESVRALSRVTRAWRRLMFRLWGKAFVYSPHRWPRLTRWLYRKHRSFR
jgi:hypothetical protein